MQRRPPAVSGLPQPSARLPGVQTPVCMSSPEQRPSVRSGAGSWQEGMQTSVCTPGNRSSEVDLLSGSQ
jgi:hypothetical protein